MSDLPANSRESSADRNGSSTSEPVPPSLQQELQPYRLFMFLLGVYVLLAMALQTFVKLDPATDKVLNIADYGVCAIFFVDFWINLYFAESKWGYLKWGWLDLVSSIPMVDMARASRLARVIRVMRALRGIRLIRLLADHFTNRRSDGAFFAIALLSLLLVLFSSIAVLQFETTPQSNIRTPEDALWWAFATITTVGYGDKYPVTTEGRIIAAVMMTAGVGMFGSFTGLIASWLLSPTQKDDEQDTELARLRVQIDEVKSLISVNYREIRHLDDDFLRIVNAWSGLPAQMKRDMLTAVDDHILRSSGGHPAVRPQDVAEEQRRSAA
ncbi:MAG: ion transporter [Planctomycetaceae bacterium]